MGRWWLGIAVAGGTRPGVFELVPGLGRRLRGRAAFPLLLDEPFTRLDAQAIAALAAVLDDLGRHGQQFLVFTGQRGGGSDGVARDAGPRN